VDAHITHFSPQHQLNGKQNFWCFYLPEKKLWYLFALRVCGTTAVIQALTEIEPMSLLPRIESPVQSNYCLSYSENNTDDLFKKRDKQIEVLHRY
jgi:hypothetical protein